MSHAEDERRPDQRELWVIVAAAGESRRMGLPDGESKQFLLLRGQSVLMHSLRRLLDLPAVAGVVVVLHPSHTVRFATKLTTLATKKPLLLAEGGRLRTDSVRAGLAEVPSSATAIAVHDGARPLFSRRVFDECLEALREYDGVVPALPVSDTLKRVDGRGRVQATVDRADLWAVQTPQFFRASALRRAYEHAVETATDDAALLEAAGYRVAVVPSTPANVKITTPADLPLAGALLAWEHDADV